MRKLFFLFIILPGFLNAQVNNDLNCRFQKLFLPGDMGVWSQLVDSLQKVKLNRTNNDILLYAEYTLIGYYMSNDQKDKAELVLAKYEKRVDDMLEKFPENANYYAFKAAAYGFKIVLSPWKAPVYSFYHQSHVDKGIKYRKNEILPLIEQANSYYFRPSFIGGNKKKALELYQKANSLLTLQNNCSWVYLSNSAWLGQVYTKMEYPEKAKQLYLKLLEQHPNFLYVKDELLPQLERGEFNDFYGRFEKSLKGN